MFVDPRGESSLGQTKKRVKAATGYKLIKGIMNKQKKRQVDEVSNLLECGMDPSGSQGPSSTKPSDHGPVPLPPVPKASALALMDSMGKFPEPIKADEAAMDFLPPPPPPVAA